MKVLLQGRPYPWPPNPPHTLDYVSCPPHYYYTIVLDTHLKMATPTWHCRLLNRTPWSHIRKKQNHHNRLQPQPSPNYSDTMQISAVMPPNPSIPAGAIAQYHGYIPRHMAQLLGDVDVSTGGGVTASLPTKKEWGEEILVAATTSVSSPPSNHPLQGLYDSCGYLVPASPHSGRGNHRQTGPPPSEHAVSP